MMDKIDMVNDALCETSCTVIIDLLDELDLTLCELDDESVCDSCGECSSRCCMDSMKVCDGCLCC